MIAATMERAASNRSEPVHNTGRSLHEYSFMLNAATKRGDGRFGFITTNFVAEHSAFATGAAGKSVAASKVHPVFEVE